jgi:hypothetical protein
MNTELRFCRSRFPLSDILFFALRAVLQRAQRGETVADAAVTSLFDTQDGARIAGCTGLFSRRDSRLWLHQQISSVEITLCSCRIALE